MRKKVSLFLAGFSFLFTIAVNAAGSEFNTGKVDCMAYEKANGPERPKIKNGTF